MSNDRVLTRRHFVGGVAVAGASTLATGSVLALNRDEVSHWHETYDVIVVGGGVSGTCAAFEAVRNGARVLLVDSGGVAANGSHGTKIYLGGGTDLQRAYGVHDTPELLREYLMATTGPTPDSQRIETYVEASVETFRWLTELGMPFDHATTGRSLQYSGCEQDYPWRERFEPVQRGHIANVPGAESGYKGGGAWLQARLIDKLKAAAGCTVITAVAEQLVTDASGRVVGLRFAGNAGGRDVRARKAVILASGGFAHNTTMVADHCPWYSDCSPTDVVWNDGWGIRAGQAVGAATRGLGACSATWSTYPPVSRKQGVLLNSVGARFIAEDAYAGRIGDAIVRQQSGWAVLLLDETIMRDGPGRFGDRVLAAGVDVDGLAGAVPFPVDMLRATLENYNHFAGTQSDPVLHKGAAHLRPLKAPFTLLAASIEGSFMPFFTLGGLKTSIQGEVMSALGMPVPNLYAVGRASAGIACLVYFSSGLSLGDCIIFGRIAGRHAAMTKA